MQFDICTFVKHVKNREQKTPLSSELNDNEMRLSRLLYPVPAMCYANLHGTHTHTHTTGLIHTHTHNTGLIHTHTTLG